MSVPEILAPAGDEASLRAALAAGADAVYFGLDEGLNARARAANFPVARLPSLCDDIHRAGVKAYVTLNTLVFEDELPAVARLVRACAEAGVDALIVQDPAVARLAGIIAPTLAVHASTQMTISSEESAAFVRSLGIRRVVVPRELSVEEIRALKVATNLELEVFIHGALCVSWSGQCLTSEAWGGRSANRGQCAQSCRMPYRLVVDGEERPLGDVEYLLSPLDLAGLSVVPRLAELGVAGLKVEGRLKGPAYVVSAVQAYRRQRDGGTPEQARADLGRMAVAYSRGFSPGFLEGSNHQTLVEGRFPKHRGVLLGEVVEVGPGEVTVRRAVRQPSGGAAIFPAPVEPSPATEAPPEPVPGAGVGFDTGHPEQEEPGGPLFAVEPLPSGWRLGFGRPGPDLSRVRPGHRVFLSSDVTLTEAARAAVRDGERGGHGRIPVHVDVRGQAGAPLTVELRAAGPLGEGLSVSGRSSAILEKAQGAGLAAELLAEKLGALGGTAFHLAGLTVDTLEPGLHLPVSELKRLRRELVDALDERLVASRRHVVSGGDPVAALREAGPWPRGDEAPARAQLVPLVRQLPQLEAVIARGLPEVELDWMELVGLEQAVRRARAAGLKVVVATTRVQKPLEQGIDARLLRLEPDGVLVRHWGGLIFFSRHGHRGLQVHADFSLNVTNSITARHVLELGADTLTAAHDLDEAQLHGMLAHVPPHLVTVTAHHHIATFHTEHCVYAHLLSHGRDFRTCGRPCERHQVGLTDVKGQVHPVVVDVGCRNTVFNAQAQSAARAVPRLLSAGVRRFRVELVREDRDTASATLEAWQSLLDGSVNPAELDRRLATHEQFGVTAGTMRTLA